MDGSSPALRVSEVIKTFGHVQALRGVNFTAFAGEVHALVGDNGAGKSTLVKIISGVHQPDGGMLFLSGKRVRFRGPEDARREGIETVYQDLAIAEALDLGENIFLGREISRRGLLGRLGFVDRPEMRRRGLEYVNALGTNIPSAGIRVEAMSGGQKQAVAVARAAAWGSSVLILDEPAAALGVRQTAQVMEMIRRSKDRGLAVILISHNVPQVLGIADRITVLQQGQVSLQCDRATASVELLVRAMSGLTDMSGDEGN